MGRFGGAIVLVTGGARGIGRATAERFAAEGAQVVVWDLVAPEPGAGTRGAEEGSIQFELVDVADEASVTHGSERLRERFGGQGLDVLVNNAGVNLQRSPRVGEIAAAEWQRLLDVNLTGALQVTQALLPLLLKARGSIVNFSSVLALTGFPGQSAYAATKAGILGLTRVWARELGPQGVRVNCVVPGYIDTAMNNVGALDFRRAVAGRTALRRLGTPDDVAAAVVFLASSDAAFVTGAALPVDGGLVG